MSFPHGKSLRLSLHCEKNRKDFQNKSEIQSLLLKEHEHFWVPDHRFGTSKLGQIIQT